MIVKKLLASTMAIIAMFAFADPVVSDVTARQRYPWNGKVDINCTVNGIEGSGGEWKFAVSAIILDSEIKNGISHVCLMREGSESTDLKVQTSGDYKLVWDAKAELGEVVYSNMVVRVMLVDAHDKVQLWEGGPYWAITNIGADEPWEYGYYFWWGDTIGYKREGNAWVATDGSTSNFSFNGGNTPTYGKSVYTLRSEGWITEAGVLAPEHDAAHVHWGGDWRMPTIDELGSLNNNCDWTWTNINGVNGYIVRGRGDYASNSIFLPCAGYGTGASLCDVGSGGYYWSSVPRSDYYNSWGLFFYSDSLDTYFFKRDYGQSVRPVQGFAK